MEIDMRCGDQTEGISSRDGNRDPFEKPRRLSRLPIRLRDMSPKPHNIMQGPLLKT